MPKTQHLLLPQRSAISSLFTATEISHQPKKRKRFPLSSRNGVPSAFGAQKLQLLRKSESQMATSQGKQRFSSKERKGLAFPSLGTRNGGVGVRGLTATPPPRGGQNQEKLPALNPKQSLARARKRSPLPLQEQNYRYTELRRRRRRRRRKTLEKRPGRRREEEEQQMKTLVHKERETKTLILQWGRTTSSPSSVAFVMEWSVPTCIHEVFFTRQSGPARLADPKYL
ncbi:hypothetical protein BHE74_00039155 [Ensete ventricosum]|nr:hypothetical protein BHE74_00039155 [Ensete ventricosum]